MKQRIRQIINDMRRQPLISGVSFIATVMSVFLFMVVAILQRLQTIPLRRKAVVTAFLWENFSTIRASTVRGERHRGE